LSLCGELNEIEGSMGVKRQGTIGIIPAAGLGLRMGGKRPKQFLEINRTPILALTLRIFQDCEAVDKVIVVAPEEDLESSRRDIVERYRLDKVVDVIPGGERRQDSVYSGLEAAGKDFALVVIHDGVRPLVERRLIEKVLLAAKTCGAAVAGLPARETVKEADAGARVIRTLERPGIWLIQTPQAFSSEVIWEAHERARREGWQEATDDAAMVERLGVPVQIVRGSERNIKITTPFDLELARFLVERHADHDG
jgi:2-C-methyl-D-erythritol 4-phosphate cytidylyltransferase